MTHSEQTDAVRQSLVGRPRDTYPDRRIPSRETQEAAVKVNAALAWLEVTKRVGVAAEQAAAELQEAKLELRASVKADIRRSQEARA